MDPDRRLSPQLSVIIPIHNEAARLESCVRHVTTALRELVAEFELVLVDDGSTDNTPEISRRVSRNAPHIHCIRLARNVGQQQATLVGIRCAQGEYVATMDADLSIDPGQLGGLLDLLRDDERCDVASGARTLRSGGFMRRCFSRLVTALLNRVCGARLVDPASTFQVARRRALDYALQNEILAQNLPLFYAFSGLVVREVEVVSNSEPTRASRYRPASLMMALALAMLNYSSGARMLSALLLAGGAMMVVGSTCCAALIIRGMIENAPLPTNRLLAGSVTVVFGGQFIAFSFLGYKLESLVRNLRLRGLPIASRNYAAAGIGERANEIAL